MKRILLQGKNICKMVSQNGLNDPILEQVSIDLYENDFTVVMGPSGSGKSTLLYSLSSMDRITGGEIEYRGNRITDLSEKQMSELRANEFGFVFQQTHLVSNLTLFENIAVAGYVGKVHTLKSAKETAEKLLMRMHIAGAKNRLPSQVSGGEAQRAAIARAVINHPGLIFADEPTGALNQSNSEEVLTLLSELNESGQSILMVTHDIRAAVRGNRILYLEDGKILDELILSAYNRADMQEREAKAVKWLSSLHW